MLEVLTWWLIMEALGLAALPLAWRAFRHLPDRGYPFARPLGLLLVGYVLWLGGMFGLLSNRRGTIALLVLAVGGVAWGLTRAEWGDILVFARRERVLLVTCEGLFLGVFAAWSLYKAFNPEIAYTEKPMEIAFLNAILRSDRFPPLDPWLSGFSISYYYFGYLLMAVLTRLSGIPSNVAYNLAVPLLMALTVTGAFSVVYNLTGLGASGIEGQEATRRLRLCVAGLGAFFVAVLGNVEGFLELLHSKGVGSADLWQWLDIYNLAGAPVSPTWYPVDNWWWWRASRVINDTVLGVHREVIDEFPFFSFMLADLHPHVLALPFTLLALGLALDVASAPARSAGQRVGGLRLLHEQRFNVIVLGLCLGALGFLNSWDFPTYTGIAIVAFGLQRYLAYRRLDTRLVGDVLVLGLAVGGLGLLLYLPFYLTFQSQASGLGLVLVEKTRLQQYLVIFGVFLWALLPVVVGPGWRGPTGSRWTWCGGLGLVAFIAAVLGWWTVALLVVLIGLSAWRLTEPAAAEPLSEDQPDVVGVATLAERFVLVLTLVGLLLTLVTEFAFIRDTFGNRMNTVFKFYYQAWVLLAIAAAYGVYYVATSRRTASMGVRSILRYVWAGGLVLLVLAGSYYPLAATVTKANLFAVTPTLDGTAFLARSSPGDAGAIRWLNEHVGDAPVILEAVGGEYSDYARVSTFTGLPAVLGWGGHELQWRGNYVEPGKREPDVDAIYKTSDATAALELLKKYGVRYVVVGRMEREKGYDAATLGKFRSFMDVVYDKDGTTIYRMRD